MTFKVSLYNAVGTYPDMAFGTTLYAADTLSVNVPNDGVTRDYGFYPANLPNIAAITLAGDANYGLRFSDASSGNLIVPYGDMDSQYTYSREYSNAALFISGTSYPLGKMPLMFGKYMLA